MEYRCDACGKEVEVEEITGDLVEITPCGVCLEAAEEAVKEEAHDQGYQEGWQAGYDTVSEEKEETS